MMDRNRKTARIMYDAQGVMSALEWTDENGKTDYVLGKRRIAIKMAELAVFGYFFNATTGLCNG